MISADIIKKLREQTGAGMSDVKSALDEAGGDESKAVEILRKAGQKVAAKKAARATKEGLIESYVHLNGKVGAMVAVACETDFVARTGDFKNFVHELALQIVAAAPLYLSPEQVPAEIIAKEKEIYAEQLKAAGKPTAMIDKIVAGKVQKYYAEVCLLKQPYIKDDKITIEKLLEQTIAKLGENIQIKDFVRLSL